MKYDAQEANIYPRTLLQHLPVPVNMILIVKARNQSHTETGVSSSQKMTAQQFSIIVQNINKH